MKRAGLIFSLAGWLFLGVLGMSSALAGSDNTMDLGTNVGVELNAALKPAQEAWEAHPRVHSVIVAHQGEPVLETVFRGPDLDTPVNVKSLSKTFMGALAGAALHRGVIDLDQAVAPTLGDWLPTNRDEQLEAITVAHLLSMSSGLEATSGAGYGAWVGSGNWVTHALSRPFVDPPGADMQYSTGDHHILAALLTEASGHDLLVLSRVWIGRPLGIDIPPWDQDPQGIYLGGNNMRLSPRALLRLGELYRLGGEYNGRRILPEGWVENSWTPRVRSRWSGDEYGFGWYMRHSRGKDIYYGRGFGGQMLYVVPELALTVVITANNRPPSAQGGGVDRLHEILEDKVMPHFGATSHPPLELLAPLERLEDEAASD